MLKPTPEHQIYQDVSAILKIYPAKYRLYRFDSPIKIRQKGYELRRSGTTHTSHRGDATDDSRRKGKRTIADLIICNDFDLFLTFTFKKDRQNIDLLRKRFNKWLKNQRDIHGKFQYIVVPEFHKDQKSIHFHALFKHYKGNLTKSGITKNNRTIYNVKSYKSGFSTAVKIDNIQKVSSYMRKYITKEMPTFKNGHRYWCSKGLKRPTIIQLNNSIPQNPQGYKQVYKLKHLTIYESPATLPEQLNKELKWLTNQTKNLGISTTFSKKSTLLKG